MGPHVDPQATRRELDVRSGTETGKYMLDVSLSGSDPDRTSAGLKSRSAASP